ncbi:hypothetical protein [Saccharicrinis sp. FJH54]|uniref:hypothetical protein n=1 Tax=Saccharicrinis sp. FJH54 TaxID=3344665 RepID=UPI0035D5060E
MKNLDIPVWIILCFAFISNTAYSSDFYSEHNSSSLADEILNFKDDQIYAAFSEIEYFVNQLNKHNNSAEAEIPSSIILNKEHVAFDQSREEINYKTSMGIPSVLWGCAFGVPGVMFIYAATDRNIKQTNNAFTGCFFNTVALIITLVSIYDRQNISLNIF